MDSEEDLYRLWVEGYQGNATDSLGSHNGYAFSTHDRDNDEAPPCCPCSPAYGGGWWFYRFVFFVPPSPRPFTERHWKKRTERGTHLRPLIGSRLVSLSAHKKRMMTSANGTTKVMKLDRRGMDEVYRGIDQGRRTFPRALSGESWTDSVLQYGGRSLAVSRWFPIWRPSAVGPRLLSTWFYGEPSAGKEANVDGERVDLPVGFEFGFGFGFGFGSRSSCFEANLNGEYHTDPTGNGYFRGIIWELWRGDYSLRRAEMKIRPRGFQPPPPPTSSDASASADASADADAPADASAVLLEAPLHLHHVVDDDDDDVADP